MQKLTAERLRELIHYNPETGLFTRLIATGRHGCHKAGIAIGCIGTQGYWVATIDGHKVYLHRAAHLYMTGEWPENHSDHINGDRTDNRWSNLRPVTQGVNNQNQRRAKSNNKSGLLGVKTCRYGFEARIAVDGRHMALGRFKTPEEAHDVYLSAKRRLHAGCTI